MPTTRDHAPIAAIEAAMSGNLEDYVRACQMSAPRVGAETLRIGTAVAAFTGRASPLTTVKGAGPHLRPDDLLAIEAFFGGRGAERATIEAAPWLDAASEQVLVARGYVVTDAEDVVIRPAGLAPVATPAASAPLRLTVEAIAAADWPEVMRRCYELDDDDGVTDLVAAAVHLTASRLVGIRESGQWIACAQTVRSGDVVVFGNDGTDPAARGRGAQTALIAERVHALADGATAVAEVAPGGVSERNYLRCGFTIAYTRTHYSRRLLH